jgi:hypothetical protein
MACAVLVGQRRRPDAQAELAQPRVVARYRGWRRVVQLGWVCLALPGLSGRAVGYGRGGGLARSRPTRLQRKPERDHDQAEDDDRQHREGQAREADRLVGIRLARVGCAGA